MLISNFHILVFIWLPLSLMFVVCGVAMVATVQRESRISTWLGTFVAANVSVQFGFSALRGISAVSDFHAALLMVVVANFWAGTMLMLANAVRFEVNRRASLASRDEAASTEQSGSDVQVA